MALTFTSPGNVTVRKDTHRGRANNELMTESPLIPETAQLSRTALRVEDLEAMIDFYRDVVGLTVLTRRDAAATLGVEPFNHTLHAALLVPAHALFFQLGQLLFMGLPAGQISVPSSLNSKASAGKYFRAVEVGRGSVVLALCFCCNPNRGSRFRNCGSAM